MKYILLAVFLLIPYVGHTQSSEVRTFDTLISQFEGDQLTCDSALRAFQDYYWKRPKDASAALYVGRAFSQFSGYYRCTPWDIRSRLVYSDSELRYLEIARSLDPYVHVRAINMTPAEAIGHAYCNRGLLKLRLGDIDGALQEFKQAERSGGLTRALIEYSRIALDALPKNAIIFTFGDNDTFPFLYLQVVEAYRRDVTVVNSSLISMPWYQHLINSGIAGLLTPAPFEQIPGSSDSTMDIPDSFALALFADSSKSREFPVENSVRPQIESQIGHRLPEQIRTTVFEPSEQHRLDFTFGSEFFQRIMVANRWRRPVYSLPYDLLMFNGIERFTRNEGLVVRFFPDTSVKFNATYGAWVDSAAYLRSIRKSTAFLPVSDSLTRQYALQAIFSNAFPAYIALLDSAESDRVIQRSAPLAKGVSYGATTTFTTVVLGLYENHHRVLRPEVEYISRSLKSLIESGEYTDMQTKAYYAASLSLLNRCQELVEFYAMLSRPRDSNSYDYQAYQYISNLIDKCAK
jgi:hypothetical protein